jgi:hypothetical protein
MPGVRVNLGLRGASLSIGRRGMTYNLGPNGSRVTAGLPGTGLSYTQTVSHQNPVTLVANSVPQRRRYSLAPLVIVAFLLGLFYLVSHPTTSQLTPLPERMAAPIANENDAVGSITTIVDAPKLGAADPRIPLPRARPKFASDWIESPLQIAPK